MSALQECLKTIPAAQREIARSALAAGLGSVPIAAIVPMSGGASGASVFRVESGARRYLLRIEGPPSPLRNPHQYVSMRIASEARIAPRIHHIDEKNGVAVMDLIVQRPLRDYPGGLRTLAQALGELLARLQAAPVFPYFVDYPDIVGRLFAHVRSTGLFADGVLDASVEHFERICAAYAWDPALSVSSHNDPNPANILFDGERLWLIDWESAYRNDPLVDVAIMLDSLAPTPELEGALLQSWLGRAPDAALRDRLVLVRALTRLYYAGVLFSTSATSPGAAPDSDLAAPTMAEYQQAIADGRLKPGAPEAAHILGKICLAGFLAP